MPNSPTCRVLLAICFAIAIQACQTNVPSTSYPEGPAWDVVDAPAVGDRVRILLLHDMEGLSGIDNPNMFRYGKPEFERGQELLAAEVNAAVDGLFAGGATEVFIVDGHGSGNPEPDLRSDLLDPRAKQIFRDEPFRGYVDLVETDTYDAVGFIGMHAKTGSGGFASHTYTLGIEFLLNDRSITETELVALSWGRADVPVILVSGDDHLQRDLSTMPWLEFVRVKNATSASSAELIPLEDVYAEFREAARRAVENLSNSKVMKLRAPVKATLGTYPPASLQLLEGVPGIDYADNTVSFTANGFMEAYDGFISLIGIARTNYSSLLAEVISSRPDGNVIWDAYGDSRLWRWLDYESDRWRPEPLEPPDPGRKYFGAR